MCPRNRLFAGGRYLDRLLIPWRNITICNNCIYDDDPYTTSLSFVYKYTQDKSPRNNLPIILIKPTRLLPPRNPNIQKLSILLRRRIPCHINNRIRTGIRRQIGTRTAHIGLEPLKRLDTNKQGQRERGRHTPGLSAKITNPSFAYVCAYCAVNMFSAALVILYAGPGIKWDCWERDMEPRDVDLFLSLCILQSTCV